MAVENEDFANVEADIANIGKFANDPAGIVQPRIGEPYKNIRKVVADAEALVAASDVGAGAAGQINQRLNRAGLHHPIVTLVDPANPNNWLFTFPLGIGVESGDWIRFQAPATNTGQIVANMPEGVPQNFWDNNYSVINYVGGMVADGRWYIMERIVNGGGSHYHLLEDTTTYAKARSGKSRYCELVSVAGRDVLLHEDSGAVQFAKGTIFVFQTGADAIPAGGQLRVNINNYIFYGVGRGGAGPYVAAIPAYSLITIIWANGPGNTFQLIGIEAGGADGAASGDPLTSNIAEIRKTLALSPNGTQIFNRGVKTQTKNVINQVDTGSSVGRGEGSYQDPADGPNINNAPGRRMSEALANFFMGGNYTFNQDNRSVNGSFDNELPTQFAAHGGGPVHILTMTTGMNSAGRFGQHAAATRPGQFNGIEAAGDAVIAAGGIPLVIDCPEPHPGGFAAAGGANGLQGWNWPNPTYNVTVPHAFDAAAKTISLGFRDFEPFGGTKLKVGSMLRVTGGPNAGDHIITAFGAGELVVIGGGTIIQSETGINRQILHIVSEAEAETLLEIPPSQTFANDVVRFPGGPPMILNRLYDSYNAGVAEICARRRWPLIRWSIAAQRWIAERGVPTFQWNPATKTMTGDPGGYTAAFTTYNPSGSLNNPVLQFNHPAFAMRDGALKPLLQEFAYDLAHGADIRGKVYGR